MKLFFSSALDARLMSGWQRAQTLRELGHHIIEFRQDPYLRASPATRLLSRFRSEVFDRKTVERFNLDFLSAVIEAKPEIAWIEKALFLLPDTLERARKSLPGCLFVCFQDDDPFGFRKSERKYWRRFIEAIPQYDVHFVKKDVSVKEFRQCGARHVLLFTSGFYPGIFHPIGYGEVSPEDRHDVVFVGTPLDHRVGMIGALINQHRIPVHVYGNLWNRKLLFYAHRKLFHPAAVEHHYVEVICGAKICLGFVSPSNRDEYSMRTFEIPACKGFFLAERTGKHLEFYEEGKEAEFFSSTEEAADKIRFYLQNEAARLRIAEGGYQRCISSNYSLHRRLADALAILKDIAR